jgi:hypothetical protein
VNHPPQPPVDPRQITSTGPQDLAAWNRLREQMEELNMHLQYIRLMLKLGVGTGPRT